GQFHQADRTLQFGFGLFIPSLLFTLSSYGSFVWRICAHLYSKLFKIAVMPRIVVRGRTFYYEEMGTQGEPLVFLSGLGGDHRAFSRPQRYFAARFRTLAFDARDAGQSDRSDSGYTTADMADDVAAWLEDIGCVPAHIVGQSLGALIAQQL